MSEEEDSRDILIVGGYGAVGRRISRRLAERFPGRVVIAGRDLGKAERLAETLNGRAIPARFDVEQPESFDSMLASTDLVVMCIDQTHTSFVEACLTRGVDYIDITATHEFLARVESMDGIARRSGATAVLSVGLAPGVTNLLSAHVSSVSPDAPHVDIFVLLGLGERHGEAAVRWTVDNLATLGSSSRSPVEGWRRVTRFKGDRWRRSAYRFELADQYVVPRTTAVDSAATWLCFDSRLVTRALGLLARTRLLRLLRQGWLQAAVVKIMGLVHLGSDRFALKACARRGRNALAESTVLGNGEGRGTALVAALVAEDVYRGKVPAGVAHIEQCFEPSAFLSRLAAEGLRWSP